MKIEYAHYTNFGISIQPACADEDGFLVYRDGFEKLDSETWTDSERFVSEMIEIIDDFRGE